MNSSTVGFDKIQKRGPIFYYVILWVVIAVGLDFFVNKGLVYSHHGRQVVLITHELAELRARLEGRLNNSLLVVYAMGAFVNVRGGIEFDEFDTLAPVLLGQSESLENIAVAKDFVVRYVYPFKGNETVVGLDYRTKANQWEMVRIARDTGNMTIAGPLNLVQGGKGLIARVPIFTGPQKTFWGLVSSVIDFDTLLKQSGFDEKMDVLDVALRGENGTAEKGDTFWGDPGLFDESSGAVLSLVVLPYGTWQMAATPKGGWDYRSPFRFWIHIGVILVFLIGFGASVYRRRSKLDLIESENRLKAMSVASIDPLIMIDSHDAIMFWNPAAEEMFGYKAEEVIGRKFHSLVVKPRDREAAWEGLEKFEKSGKGPVLNQVLEMEAVRRSGEVFQVERSVAAFRLKGKWYAVGSLRDITARKDAERQLTEMATMDALTGLCNRRYFLELADLQVRQASRYRKDISFIMFDLDHFKKINDTYGHDAGDRVLQTVARMVKKSLREVDIVGRIGGEEFAVALPETNLDAGRQVAERIRKTLMEATVETEAGVIQFTVSIGLTQLGSQQTNLTELMKQADQALYEAKRNGRNQVAAFSLPENL